MVTAYLSHHLCTEATSDTCVGGESAWEKVSSFVDSGEETPSATDEYAALTAQLAASGPAAGTRARTRRPTSAVSSC